MTLNDSQPDFKVIHNITLSISETAKDTAIVAIECQ